MAVTKRKIIVIALTIGLITIAVILALIPVYIGRGHQTTTTATIQQTIETKQPTNLTIKSSTTTIENKF